LDHPSGIERPYVHVTAAEKAKAAREKRAERKANGIIIILAELKVTVAEMKARFGRS